MPRAGEQPYNEILFRPFSNLPIHIRVYGNMPNQNFIVLFFSNPVDNSVPYFQQELGPWYIWLCWGIIKTTFQCMVVLQSRGQVYIFVEILWSHDLRVELKIYWVVLVNVCNCQGKPLIDKCIFWCWCQNLLISLHNNFWKLCIFWFRSYDLILVLTSEPTACLFPGTLCSLIDKFWYQYYKMHFLLRCSPCLTGILITKRHLLLHSAL